MYSSKPYSPRKIAPDYFKKQAGNSEKLEIVIVGDADAGKGIFLSALLGRKRIDPMLPLVKFVTVDAMRYQLDFTVCIGNERSYLLFDQPSKHANGFIFLYNVSLRHTFAAFERWRETIAPMSDSDDVPPVLLLGFAPNERSRDRKCISTHESRVLADSYGFQHREVDYDSDMTPLLQKLVADIRRDEYEALEDESSTPLIDMVVLGDVFVGKTSLVNRLLSGEFETKYVSSGQIRPRKVKVMVDDSLAVLRLRDTPGTMYQAIINSEVMHVVHSAVIVYDVTSRATFETAQAIRRMIMSAKQEKRLSFVLIGNKCDDQFLVPRQVSYDEGLVLSRTWKCPFFEVSAKTRNVDHVFREAIREFRLVFNYDLISSPKLEWSGQLQMNDGSGKFSKKFAFVLPGKFAYSSKPDISKAKMIDLNSKVGVIEGNHDKGALLILSIIGGQQLQCLLPTVAERSAFADALFAELALHNVALEIFASVTKSTITEFAGGNSEDDSNNCILAHGRLPSSSTSLAPSNSSFITLPANGSTTSAANSASSSNHHPNGSASATPASPILKRK